MAKIQVRRFSISGKQLPAMEEKTGCEIACE
jgi:hypothetical protein